MSKEVFQVADALHSAAVRLLRTVRHVDRKSGLSPARLSALSVIVFAGPITVGKLAAAEGVRSPTMTGIVNGLVQDGLVERRAALGDHRVVEVTVTPKGRRLFGTARRRRVEAVADLLRALPEDDLVRIGETVAILRRTLQPKQAQPTLPSRP